MEEVTEILEKIREKALQDRRFRHILLESRNTPEPVTEFCKAARANGFMLYPMDLIEAGEAFHATMKRSTNGGGENSPMLSYQDDIFEILLEELAENGKDL